MANGVVATAEFADRPLPRTRCRHKGPVSNPLWTEMGGARDAEWWNIDWQNYFLVCTQKSGLNDSGTLTCLIGNIMT